MSDIYIAVIGHDSDAEPILDLGIFGPFDTVGEAQEFTRSYREENGIPGHANAVPTSEENEAWTACGWTFAIRPLAHPDTAAMSTASREAMAAIKREQALRDPAVCIEDISDRYRDRCLAVLNKVRALCKQEGMFASEVGDLTTDEFQWGIGVWLTPEQGEAEDSVSVELTLEEAVPHGDDEQPFGMSWSLTAIKANGETVAELRPYNYTPECWVDGRDEEEVEARFALIEKSNLADIPRLIKEAA